jgi:hypothetical protein
MGNNALEEPAIDIFEVKGPSEDAGNRFLLNVGTIHRTTRCDVGEGRNINGRSGQLITSAIKTSNW